MNIVKQRNDSTLVLKPIGRLDTLTSSHFEDELKQSLDGIRELVLDLAELDYVSSAGLRVLLAAQKRMAKTGKMRLVNVNPAVMEVLEMTGFADILTIEK